MNYKIKDIIKKANLEYSDGNIYTMSEDELNTVNKVLGLDIQEMTLVDSVYDIIYAKANITC